MKARKQKQPEIKASEDLELVKWHQVSEMTCVYFAVVAVVFVFIASALPQGIVGVRDALGQVFPVCALILCFIMSFTQLNHCMADKLNQYQAELQSHFADMLDYLHKQKRAWKQLFSSFFAVNPRPEISFFDRLSDLLGLTQLPLLSLPLAFRS